MDKPVLYMPIGLPGCGKSTFAEEKRKEGCAVHSSDAIREELGLTNNAEVFRILGDRVKADLKNGVSCVYDATNLSRKNRRGFLEELNNIPCVKTAVLYLIPVEVCMERNAKRTGNARVPEDVYDKMLRSFTVPDPFYEGFDGVAVVTYDEPFVLPDYADLDDFAQENPHHAESLGEHMKEAAKNAEYLAREAGCDDRQIADIAEAARWHDIGKYHTKDFHNSKGEPTEIAHYYGHENVGAYMYLLKAMQEHNLNDRAFRIANLINWHMTPFKQWRDSAKRFAFDHKHLPADFLQAIDIIHQADELSSHREEDLEQEKE